MTSTIEETDDTWRPHARPWRAFAWTPFAIIPKKETQTVIGLKDSAPKSLWLALVLASGGFGSRVEFTNERLRAAAKIGNENTFRDARRKLQEAGVLTATPVEGSRKERYVYDLAPSSQRQRLPKPKVKIKTRATTAPTVKDVLSSNLRVNSWGE